MKIAEILIGLIITGIVASLCLFIWLLVQLKEEIWGMIEEKEEESDRRS